MILEVLLVCNVALHGIVISLHDIKSRIIPNRFLISFLSVQVFVILLLSPQEMWEFLKASALIGTIVFVAYFLLASLSGGRFGMGDVKALAATAIAVSYFSPELVVAHIALTHILGMAFGVALLLQKRGSTIPYAIPIFASAVAVSVYGSLI